jgi:hypothetical protein
MPHEEGIPIMELVRQLQNQVESLRADKRKWHWVSFVSGLISGLIAMWLMRP